MRKAPPTETRAAPERTAPSSSSSSISSSIALRTFLGAGTGGGSPVGRRLSSSALSAAATPSKSAKGRPPNQMSQRTSGSRTTAGAPHGPGGRQPGGPGRPVEGVGAAWGSRGPSPGDAARPGDDLLAAAVAERERQDHLVVLRAVEPQLLQRIAPPRGQPVQLA